MQYGIDIYLTPAGALAFPLTLPGLNASHFSLLGHTPAQMCVLPVDHQALQHLLTLGRPEPALLDALAAAEAALPARSPFPIPHSPFMPDALATLVALHIPRHEAQQRVQTAAAALGPNATLQDLVRAALKRPRPNNQ